MRNGKGVFHVSDPLKTGKLHLRAGFPVTDKRKAVDRQPGIAAEFASQKRRLIVASFDQPGIMKRHRHDDVDPGFENILARHFQHGRQKPRIFGPIADARLGGIQPFGFDDHHTVGSLRPINGFGCGIF